MNEKFQSRSRLCECGIENFEFIVSKRVQVNPDNALAECVDIFIIQIEYTAQRNRQILSQPKPWGNDSGVLNLHHGYYTTIMTSRRLFCHSPVSANQKIGIRTVYESSATRQLLTSRSVSFRFPDWLVFISRKYLPRPSTLVND